MAHWSRTLKPAVVRSFAELRLFFSSADQVGKLTVFNIAGNTARLIAAVHYNRQKIYIRAVLTHDEYDEENRAVPARTLGCRGKLGCSRLGGDTILPVIWEWAIHGG